MVVHDLDVVGASGTPSKAEAPLLVDADAVRTGTVAGQLLEDGVHPRVVQERLGHSTIAITLGIYSHVSPRLHDEAANQVARLMLPEG